MTALHLTEYMAGVGYNIELVNQHVKAIHDSLIACGEQSSDLLVNLFVTYRAVPDQDFVAYVNKQKDKYDEGEDIKPKKLMNFAITRYKDRVRSNVWQAPSAEQEQIIALTTKLDKLSKVKVKSNPPAKGTKDRVKSKRTREDDPKFAWKLVPPKEGDPKTKVVNGKTYHFGCPHNAWVFHARHECRKTKRDSKPEAKGKMELAKAMQTILENDSSDDKSEGEDDNQE